MLINNLLKMIIYESYNDESYNNLPDLISLDLISLDDNSNEINYLLWLPDELVLYVGEFLYMNEHINFRKAFKLYRNLTPVDPNILNGLKILENGALTVHFRDKETCVKVIKYVKKNYNVSHLCCNDLGIMLKNSKDNRLKRFSFY